MIKREFFQCEFCGTVYQVEENCVRCEGNHKRIVSTRAAKYLPLESDKSGYPTRVVVTMSDGKEMEYSRKK